MARLAWLSRGAISPQEYGELGPGAATELMSRFEKFHAEESKSEAQWQVDAHKAIMNGLANIQKAIVALHEMIAKKPTLTL